MNYAERIVKKPVTILVFLGLILIVGGLVVRDLAIDFLPEFNPPVLIIVTTYEGAEPEQVEQRITRPIESVIMNVRDIQEVTSTSSKGISTVVLMFEWSKDLNIAQNEVRDKLEMIKRFLPEEAELPQIFKIDPQSFPIMYFTVQGDRSEQDLFDIADDILVPRLEQISGVASATLSGAREPIVSVEAKQNRLDAYNLSLTQVSQILASQNIKESGGELDEGLTRYIVTNTGEFKTLEQIEDTVVTSYNGVPVRIRDFADVKMGFKDRESVVYINGKPGLQIAVTKQSGSNSVKVADNVYKELEKIQSSLPYGVSLNLEYDMTKFIRTIIGQVGSSALYGALLAMIVLFIFLRSPRATIIVGVSIPVSLLITMMAMYFAGLSLNIISLTGLILGIGMIVDSSIVIIENIFRYREKGSKLKTSAVLGTTEMLGAISGSTLTTVAVFLPMVLFQKELEVIGVFTRDLAFTIVIALMSSLFVAIVLVPVLASRKLTGLYSKKQRPIKTKTFGAVDKAIEYVLVKIDNGYKASLRYIVNHLWIKLTIFLVVFFVMIPMSLFYFGSKGFNLFPEGNDDQVTLAIELPPGTKLSESERIAMDLAQQIERDIKGISSLFVAAGNPDFFGNSKSNEASIQILLLDGKEKVENSYEVQQTLREYFDQYPNAQFKFDSGRGGMGGGMPIDVQIKTQDLEKAKEIADQLLAKIKERLPEVLEPDISLDDALPQIEVDIDRAKASSLGLNVFTIGSEVAANINGRRATIYRSGSDEYDVVVRLAEEDRMSMADIDRITVTNPMGQKIPISSFATLKYSQGPVKIDRIDQSRVVSVQGGKERTASTTKITREIQKIIDEEIIIDNDVIITFGGDAEDIQNLVWKVIKVFFIALLLVFAIMASIFENIFDPLIIFLTLPTLFIGVAIIYFLSGQGISAFTFVGIVMLSGIVVNNGIVLVDYTNLLRNRGYCIKDAIVEAGGSRLRPVLMTTLTTVLGMVPMAFFPGEGSDMVQPLGFTVIGGLTFNTLITLFLVPVIYYAFNFHRVKKAKCSADSSSVNDEGVEEDGGEA
ncbi:MAG: efflux RND transporter permease subunit [Spirochaetales bacterium]|nr:efflux RND transporter permease subunit [Spirochaetales bacterium]